MRWKAWDISTRRTRNRWMSADISGAGRPLREWCFRWRRWLARSYSAARAKAGVGTNADAARRWRALLDFEDFFFFGAGGLVDFVHIAVGQLLNLVVGALVFVFGDVFVLEQRLDGLVAVAPDIAHRYAVMLGNAVQAFDEFLAALLGKGRYGQPDHLAIVRRIQAQVGDPDGLLDRADLRCIPRRDRNHAGLGNMQGRHLIQRRGRSVVIHTNVIEQAQSGAAGANGGHFVL